MTGCLLGLLQQRPHAFVQCRTAQFEGIIHGPVDAHVEPTVDVLLQKLHRKIKHDGGRSQGQHSEQRHHPRRELGTGRLAVDLAH